MNRSAHLRYGRYSKAGYFYFVTCVTHQRTPYFDDFHSAKLIIQNMKQLDLDKLSETICFVVMPDHIHWLFKLGDSLSLSNVVRALKGRTAHQFKVLNPFDRLWQRDFYDRAIRNEEELINTARYIVANPLRAGLVKRVEDYPYWDCIYL